MIFSYYYTVSNSYAVVQQHVKIQWVPTHADKLKKKVIIGTYIHTKNHENISWQCYSIQTITNRIHFKNYATANESNCTVRLDIILKLLSINII